MTVAAASDVEAPDGVSKDDALFADALQAIQSAAPAYDVGLRRTVSAPDYVEPRAYCERALATALASRRFYDVRRRRAFFRWAIDAAPRLKLTPVLAAVDHGARGETGAARRYLDLALALNQDDLFAQSLWLAIERGGRPEPDMSGKFCTQPFEQIETQSRDRVFLCCPAWMPATIGDASKHAADEVWNSQAAQDVRASIHDGSFRYCSRMHCPRFTADQLPDKDAIDDPAWRAIIDAKTTRLEHGPKMVYLSHDRSCQLSCPSCRTTTIMARADAVERMNAMAGRTILPLLKDARNVVITGSGDAFASKHYRAVLAKLTKQAFPSLRIDLMTNGLLIKRHWEELSLEGRVRVCYVSVDAAEADTYRVLRRGGAFDDLLENLAFLSALRRDARVDRVRLDFVTQASNFREMPKAAELMRRHGFDGIKFQMIRSWNTYAPEEFQRHHIGAPDHPEHGAFLDVLADPRLQGDDVEFYGFYSVAAKRRRDAI